jgi:hypothetical protein
MASPQTTVPSEMLFAVPGQIADQGTAMSDEPISCVNAEASNEIPFGHFVAQGTTGSDGNVTAKRMVEDGTLLGLAVYSSALGHSSLTGTTGIKAGVTFAVARKGRYYVMPITDVTPASGVHILHTTVSSDLPGAIRGTADAGDSIDASDFCKWLSSGGPTSGQCAVLEIMLPAGSSLATENS